jgi:hypothetical protein
MTVAILGCGPAGLLAAHAATLAGEDVVIYSHKVRSKIVGAQYLHKPVPGLTNSIPQGTLTYHYVGTKEGYATKVYGDPTAKCSWKKFPEQVPYWPMNEVYEMLWQWYEPAILDHEINSEFCRRLAGGSWTLVINSVPLNALVSEPGHYEWSYEYVWIRQGGWAGQDQIIYNGTDRDEWYRTSNIHGHEFTEYGGEHRPEEAVKIRKPLTTTCRAWREFLHVGRYGKWSKEELAHQAFEDTWRSLQGMQDLIS